MRMKNLHDDDGTTRPSVENNPNVKPQSVALRHLEVNSTYIWDNDYK